MGQNLTSQILINKLKDGIALQEKGRLQDAKAVYDSILKLNPNNYFALQLSGVIAAQFANYSEACELLSRAIEIDATDPNVLNNYGVALKEFGNLDMAIEFYQKSLQINPKHYEAYNNLGVVFAQLKQNETALENYDHAISLKSDYVAAHFNRGLALQELGRFDDALISYETSIFHQRDYVQAYLNRGALLEKLKRYDDALENYQTAISIIPNCSELFNGLGTLMRTLSQYQDALNNFEFAISLNPNHFAAHFNRGLVLQDLDRFDEALIEFNQVNSLNPNESLGFINKALILRKLNRLDEALNCLNEAMINGNVSPDLHYTNGVILEALNRLDEAEICFKKVLEIDPQHADSLNSCGVLYKNKGLYGEALANLFMAIAIKPDHSDAYSNVGITLQELNHPDEALAYYDKAIQFGNGNSNISQYHYNRAVTLQKLSRLNEAIEGYNLALSFNPYFAKAHNNVGVSYSELHELDRCLEHYNQAIECDPDFHDPIWNRSLILLLLGNYSDGWRDFEYRFRIPSTASSLIINRDFKGSLWLGGESLVGKTILLVSEQGLGDTLQFSRYVRLVKNLGAEKIIFEVQKPLQSLMQNFEGVEVIELGAGDNMSYDFYCPLMSLPLAFGCDLETIPSPVPFTSIDSEKVEYWAKKLGPKTKPRVGLVWSGGFRPDQPELWATNLRRNLPVSKLEILGNCNVDFVSLQKGELAELELLNLQEEGWGGLEIINYANELNDFTDTAALITSLDLVISVDTSTAHLAATLGKPTWILNRFDTCWRWFLDQSDSPWYPSVTLFRQSEPGDWDEVLRRVSNQLDSIS